MSGLSSCALHDVDAAAWNALADCHQPFLQHAFLSTLEDSGSVGPGTGWQPAHRLLTRADGSLAAALPAYVKSHSQGEYVFDHGWADACHRAGIRYYPKLLAAIPFSPIGGPRLLGDAGSVQQLLAALESELAPQGLSGLHINFTDAAADLALQNRPGWLPRLGCQFHWQNRDYRDFADFLDSLRSSKRKKLRKERELVGLQGIDFRWLQGGELSEADWDFVYTCYRNTYVVRDRLPYLTRAFFSLLAERMPGAIRVVLARQHGRPVAMALSLVGGSTLYGRYWGCLQEFHALHFETCLYQGLDMALSEGLSVFDAGAQGEHKLVRGFEPVLTRSWHYLLHPGLRQAVQQFLLEEAAGVQAYLQQARAALPYRVERPAS